MTMVRHMDSDVSPADLDVRYGYTTAEVLINVLGVVQIMTRRITVRGRLLNALVIAP